MNAQTKDRIASAAQVATYFRQDCRSLRDSLQVEMVVAQYLIQMRDARSPEGVPVGDAVSAGVIGELERHGDPLSHAMLRALEHITTGETARWSAEAVARLAANGVGLPVKFADVAGSRSVGAWQTSAGGRGREYALFVEFEHSLGSRHSLALFVRGGVAKHIALMHPMDELEPEEPFHPSAMEVVELAAAGPLLRDVLDRSFGPHSGDYRVLIAGARARSMG
jgi:hypothetical protein